MTSIQVGTEDDNLSHLLHPLQSLSAELARADIPEQPLFLQRDEVPPDFLRLDFRVQASMGVDVDDLVAEDLLGAEEFLPTENRDWHGYVRSGTDIYGASGEGCALNTGCDKLSRVSHRQVKRVVSGKWQVERETSRAS